MDHYFRLRFLESAIYAGIAIALIGLGTTVRALLAPYELPHDAEIRLPLVQFFAFAYGCGFLALAVVAVLLDRWGWRTPGFTAAVLAQAAWRDARALFRTSYRGLREDGTLYWLLVAMMIGAGVRLWLLSQPMRYDEAFTVNYFVSTPVYHTFHYMVPNNHVLHTIFVRATVFILGDAPEIIRIPAFLAGILTIPAVALLARSFGMGSASVIPALMISVWPHIVLYDTMGRGYSLVSLTAVILAGLILRLTRRPTTGVAVLIGVTTAIGLFTIPSFVFCAAGLAVWYLFLLFQCDASERVPRIRLAAVSFAIALCLTFLAYTPVILASNGVGPIIANPFVVPLPWTAFFERLPGHIRETIGDCMRGIPFGGPLLGATTLIGMGSLKRSKRYELASLLPAVLIGGGVVLILQHAIPFTRTWLFLLPFAAIIICAGIDTFLVHAMSVGQRNGLAVAASLGSAILLASSGLIEGTDDTGKCLGAKTIAIELTQRLEPDDIVVAVVPADAPVEYYMRRRGVSKTMFRPSDLSTLTVSPRGRTFYVVQTEHYTLGDLRAGNARLIVKDQDLRLFVSAASGERTAVRDKNDEASVAGSSDAARHGG